MKNTKLSLVLAGMLALTTTTYADDKSDIAELKQQVKELQEQTQTLTDETSDLQTGFNYTVLDDSKSYTGLGIAASKVYYSKSPLSIGGYGEMYYANTKKDGTTSSVVDVYRFVPYIGYKFTDNIILNTELEFEHGGSKQGSDNLSGGYVIVEFMYLDFLIHENFNARVGNILVPMGLINERHEPTLFNTVQRPSTEKYLIPSTWHESGAMVYGNIVEGVQYKAGFFAALNTTDNNKEWIRKGRAGSLKQKNPGIGYIARVDYTGTTGLLVGASVYGQSDLLMVDAHIDYKIKGARVYGVYTQTSRTNATDVNAVSAPESAKGGYLNLSYDVLSTTSSDFSLPVFLQYESVNTTDSAAGTAPVTTSAVGTTTLGINFFPHPQVVLKMDYAMADNQYGTVSTADKISSETLSISMGFIF
ncbi:MAG: hypothetical protein SPLUMA1_SPLUMAMAG1_01012 [uncultured Sulfurimonas sp.]|nr:MAG: hypothetical protein SPLUMA1_SPLUMAMAG1_01012 [uncultured Sulfurimonas sp.]